MRYFITFLIGIGLVVLLIILLIRAIFGGGDSPEPKTELLTYANTNTVMRLTIDGPIVADQDHRQIRIDVSQYSSDLRTITGYEGRVDKSATFPSNPTAYANFLRALDLMGYTNGNDDEAFRDERGYCPFGRRYVFEILDGSESKQRFWSTSCGDNLSFKGEADGVLRLFKEQIPDYRQQTAGTGIN